MIKNLAITTPILGAIRLGEVVENKDGKRIPVRNNHFKITGQYKDADGNWVEHPLHKKVAAQMGVEPDKITEIPIRLMFNDPELNMRARYEAFDRSGRIVCAGDGATARRSDGGKIETVQCPGADHCKFGVKANCDLFGRLNVMIDGQDDQFSTFIIRTESFNSVRTVFAKMSRMRAMFGNRLAGVPFKLKLVQKASKASYWSKFFYFDLQLHNVSLEEAGKLAIDHENAMTTAGLDMKAFEDAARKDLANGAFEDSQEEFEELEPFVLRREIDGEGGEPGDAQGQAGDHQPAVEGNLETALPAGLAGLRDMINMGKQLDTAADMPQGEDMFASVQR